MARGLTRIRIENYFALRTIIAGAKSVATRAPLDALTALDEVYFDTASAEGVSACRMQIPH